MSRRPITQPNRQLAKVIQELLDLDSLREATIILRAVLQAVKDALLRGESVYIRGFGTFKFLERTHKPTPNNILVSNGRCRPVAYSPVLMYYKPRRVLVFEPSIPLMAMLNMDSPNYKERRAQLNWQRQSNLS